MGAVKPDRKDLLFLAYILLWVPALIASGGLVGGVVAGSVGGGVVGVVGFMVAAFFAGNRLDLGGKRCWQVWCFAWAASAGLGLLVRFFPAGILLVIAGLAVDTVTNRRRIQARVERERALRVLGGRP